jgi:hypothetical protein
MHRTEERSEARASGYPRSMLRAGATMVVCLAALAATGCGGSDTEDARHAAEAYVHDFGKRDGKAICDDMTRALQGQFRATVVQANPQVKGQSCANLMNLALASLPQDQLRRFASAKIDRVEVDGSQGTFRYHLGSINVPGKVAKEDGEWKVSCCLQGG